MKSGKKGSALGFAPVVLFLCVGTGVMGCVTKQGALETKPTPAEQATQASQAAASRAIAPKAHDAGCARYATPAQQTRWQARRAQLTSPEARGRFAIAGLNDLHGHLETETISLKDAGKERKTKVGGIAAMAAYFEALCEEYMGRVVFLDAGDAYQGTLVSNLSQGEAVVEAYNALGIHVSTFGNHEFDFGQEALLKILSLPRNFSYVSANIRDAQNTTELPWKSARVQGLQRSTLLQIDDLKVGVVGFTTVTTPLKTFPDRVRGLAFLSPLAKTPVDPLGVVASEAKKLREAGAQHVVLLGHAGGVCDMTLPPEKGDEACVDKEDELSEVLKALPPGTVDAAFGGHAHRAGRHFVAGVPLLQTTGNGMSFSLLEVLPAKKIPREPVFFCHEHFEGYASCNPKEREWGRSYSQGVFTVQASKVPELFGRKINLQGERPRAVETSMVRFFEQVRLKKQEPVASLPVRLDHDREAESALGNCYTDATKAFLSTRLNMLPGLNRVDVVVVNSGGIRTGLSQGALVYNDVFTAFPFDNTLVAMEMTGKEFLGFLRQIESSPRDLPYVSEGFLLRLTESKKAPRVVSVERQGKVLRADERVVVVFSDFTQQFVETVVGSEAAKVRTVGTQFNVRDVFAQQLRSAPLPASCKTPTLGRHVLTRPAPEY